MIGNIWDSQADELNYVTIDYYEGKYYTLSRKDGMLLSRDCVTGLVEVIARVADEGEVYISSALTDGKLFFFPWAGRRICIYNIRLKQLKYVDFSVGGESVNPCISFAFVCGENVFAFGWNRIVDYCYTSNTIETNMTFDGVINSISNPCFWGGSFWIPIKEKDSVLQYNVMKKTIIKREVLPRRGMEYNCAVYANNYIWLAGDKDIIVRWNPMVEESSCVDIQCNGFRIIDRELPWKGVFSAGVVLDEIIILAPLNSNVLLQLDSRSKKQHTIKEFTRDTYCFQIRKLSNELVHIESDECLISPNVMNGAYIFDGESIEPFSIPIDRIDWDYYFKNSSRLNSKNRIEYECKGMLESFVENM